MPRKKALPFSLVFASLCSLAGAVHLVHGQTWSGISDYYQVSATLSQTQRLQVVSEEVASSESFQLSGQLLRQGCSEGRGDGSCCCGTLVTPVATPTQTSTPGVPTVTPTAGGSVPVPALQRVSLLSALLLSLLLLLFVLGRHERPELP